MEQVKLIVLHYEEVIGVIDCFPISVNDMGMNEFCRIIHAPKAENGIDYLDVKVGDAFSNGVFYRDNLLLTPTDEIRKEHPELCWSN